MRGALKVILVVELPEVAKIFGPTKPLQLRVAIAIPCDKPRSRHNAGARG